MDKSEKHVIKDVYVCTFPYGANKDTEPKMDVKQS